MKLIRTEDAVGHVLCHDMTQIIKDKYKDARFRKGHVVTEEDIPVLLSMGKEHLYVWEMTPGMVHENDAAERLLTLCGQENMLRSEVKEGKIELKAACDGVFLVDSQRLIAVNSQDEVMIATRKGGTAVRAGDKLAGMRVIPLIIAEEKLQKAERAAGDRDVYLDGGELVRQALDADLVDEMTVTMIPVVLGAGRPLFAGVGNRHELELTASRQIGSGLVQLVYLPR